ncbi:MAG: hypothetical protein ACXWF8_05385 [Methylobacter sp.]
MLKKSLRQQIKQWCNDNPARSRKDCLSDFNTHTKSSVIKYYQQFKQVENKPIKQVESKPSLHSQIVEWRYDKPDATLRECCDEFTDASYDTVKKYFDVSSPKDTKYYVEMLCNSIMGWLNKNPDGSYEQCFDQIGKFGHYEYSQVRFEKCWKMVTNS